MIFKKKKSYFEEELDKNRNKPKEIWKALMTRSKFAQNKKIKDFS